MPQEKTCGAGRFLTCLFSTRCLRAFRGPPTREGQTAPTQGEMVRPARSGSNSTRMDLPRLIESVRRRMKRGMVRPSSRSNAALWPVLLRRSRWTPKWPRLEVESQFLPAKRPLTAVSQGGKFRGSAPGRTRNSSSLMREAHEVPSCGEELPFYPRVMT